MSNWDTPRPSPLRLLREQREWTQYRLQQESMVSRSTIHAIEVYGYRPKKRVRQKLAHALDVNESELWPEISAPEPVAV